MSSSEQHRVRSAFPSSSRRRLRRAILPALYTILIGCGSSTDAPAGVTGVWGGRAAFLTQSDTFTFYLTQNGATVEGWGLRRPVGVFGAIKYSGTGTLSGGQLDLSLTEQDQLLTGLGSPYFLRGALNRGRMEGVFGYITSSSRGFDTTSSPITLRLTPATASELVGKWARTSSTGAPGSPLHDTIIVNADRRAWRYKDVYLLPARAVTSRAVWAQSGNWLVIEHEAPDLFRDSLLIQSGELQRTTVNGDGTRVDHYTRLSTSGELP